MTSYAIECLLLNIVQMLLDCSQDARMYANSKLKRELRHCEMCISPTEGTIIIVKLHSHAIAQFQKRHTAYIRQQRHIAPLQSSVPTSSSVTLVERPPKCAFYVNRATLSMVDNICLPQTS